MKVDELLSNCPRVPVLSRRHRFEDPSQDERSEDAHRWEKQPR